MFPFAPGSPLWHPSGVGKKCRTGRLPRQVLAFFSFGAFLNCPDAVLDDDNAKADHASLRRSHSGPAETDNSTLAEARSVNDVELIRGKAEAFRACTQIAKNRRLEADAWEIR
jgi:hypothetical protein